MHILLSRGKLITSTGADHQKERPWVKNIISGRMKESRNANRTPIQLRVGGVSGARSNHSQHVLFTLRRNALFVESCIRTECTSLFYDDLGPSVPVIGVTLE